MSMWETILIAFAAASSAPVPGKEQPITIQWQTTGDLVEVKVVGLAQKAIQLTYILEVTGTSNTRTSGIANLAAGTPKTLSTVRVRPTKGWKARLIVSGDRNYTVHQPT